MLQELKPNEFERVRPQKRAPCFAVGVAEVAVDAETGQVFLTRLTTAQDAGRAAQAARIALWEQVRLMTFMFGNSPGYRLGLQIEKLPKRSTSK